MPPDLSAAQVQDARVNVGGTCMNDFSYSSALSDLNEGPRGI